MVVNLRLGKREGFGPVSADRAPCIAIKMIETLGNIARHLDVLHLVATDRNLVGVEDQNVGGHQYGVHEKPGVDAGIGVLAIFGIAIDRCLVGMRTVEQSLRGNAGQ